MKNKTGTEQLKQTMKIEMLTNKWSWIVEWMKERKIERKIIGNLEETLNKKEWNVRIKVTK
jgi:hypothetical protein